MNRKVCSRGRLKETWKSRRTIGVRRSQSFRAEDAGTLSTEISTYNYYIEISLLNMQGHGTQDTQRGNFDIR